MNSGNWQLTGGVYDAVGNGADAWVYAGDMGWTDYGLEVRANMLTGNTELIIRSTGHWQNEYRITVWPYYSGEGNYYNRVELTRYKNGVGTSLWGIEPGDPIPNVTTIRLEAKGNRIVIYVNGNIQIDYTDSDPLLSGRIGLGVIRDRHVQFDNLNVATLP